MSGEFPTSWRTLMNDVNWRFFLSATAWTITWCLSKLNMWALSPYLLNRTAEMVVAWFWMTIWIHHPTKMPFRNPLVI
jgi:hypothetical protein